jgi:uncharacterized protein (TIGR03435 family)
MKESSMAISTLQLAAMAAFFSGYLQTQAEPATPAFEVAAKAAVPASEDEMRLLALVPAKGGASIGKSPLQESSAEGDASIEHLRPGLRMVFRKQPISALADFLSTLAAVNRPVLDRSGLTKLYDFQVDLKEASIPGIQGLSVSTELQAQLGLKLEAGKGFVEILVMDRAERLPVEN